jgi:hypothetical protein
MRNVLTAENITSGMTVYDSDGNKGIVRDCKDLHNVHVTFDGTGITIDWYETPIECSGSGLYCFIENCDDNSEKSDILYY